MNLADIVRGRLAAVPAITTIVDTRIYLEESPDDAPLPLIVYAVRLGATVDGSALVQPATVQVHGYAEDDDTALALGQAITAALEGFGGQSGTTRLASLNQSGWDEMHSFDDNLWGRLLTFEGTVIRS